VNSGHPRVTTQYDAKLQDASDYKTEKYHKPR